LKVERKEMLRRKARNKTHDKKKKKKKELRVKSRGHKAYATKRDCPAEKCHGPSSINSEAQKKKKKVKKKDRNF
ncbi:hypothetical protein IscW_ISCW004217, partial [Ixodes scapularis]